MLRGMTSGTRTTNDNDETWISLAAATARALELHKKQDEKAGGDTNAGSTDKDERDDHRRYVDQRLRDLAAFERRATRKP